MAHLLTLELPLEYRRKGPDLVGLALFQADDHVATPTPGAREALMTGVASHTSALLASLVRAHGARHPQRVDLVDLIGGHFAVLWLRDEELRGPRTAPPADDRDPTSPVETGQNMNAWDHTKPELAVWLAERSFDPNAGKAPTEGSIYDDDNDDDADGPPPPYEPSDAYVDVVLTRVEKLKAFYEEHHGRSHLGGTCLPVQQLPEGLTPWFLELENDIGGANFGGGNLQYDLERDILDWACG